MKDRYQYPHVIRVADVAEIMGIKKRTAYQVMEIPGFPLINPQKGRMKLVYRDAFFQWLESQRVPAK